ncbi:MAG: porin family protein [Verrucomicrobia bacterium]|nr:porin family protein [Verrucomicrobiota bacterium]
MKKILLLISLFIVASNAFAGTYKDGPHIGKVLGGDPEEESTIYGWQVAYEFDNEIVSLELVGAKQEDKLGTPGLLPGKFAADIDIWALSFTMAVRAGYTFFDRVHLYGSVGYAYYDFHADADAARRVAQAAGSGSATYNAGAKLHDVWGTVLAAGMEIKLSDSWELIAEYRSVSLDTEMDFDLTETNPAPAGFGMATFDTQTTYTENVPYDHDTFRVGVNFRF